MPYVVLSSRERLNKILRNFVVGARVPFDGLHKHITGPAYSQHSLLDREAHESLAAQVQKLAAMDATLEIKVRLAHCCEQHASALQCSGSCALVTTHHT